MGPLIGLRVLDATTRPEALLTSTLLADLGADVVQLELDRAGHAARRVGPVKGDVSLLWKATGRSKRSVAVDTDAAGADGLLATLLELADVLVVDAVAAPGGVPALAPRTAAAHPHLVVLVTTPFGMTGPYASRPGGSRAAEAFGGQTFTAGDPARTPLHSGSPLGAATSALLGALAVMAALHERDHRGSGRGQVIDQAGYEAVLRFMEFLPNFQRHLGFLNERAGMGSSYQVPVGTWRTADRKWLSFTGNTNDIVHRLYRAMGSPELIDDPRFATNEARVKNRDVVEPRITEWIAAHTQAELDAVCATEHVPIGWVFSIADIFVDENYDVRGSIATVADGELGQVRVPRSIPRFSRSTDRPPTLGNARAVPVTRADEVWATPRDRPVAAAPPAVPGGTGPLAGLRVLDIGQILAGPFSATLLADLGADVVKVEKGGGDDFRRQAPLKSGVSLWWTASARNKQSISLDLKDDADRATFLDLVTHADIVIGNFVPGTLERLGLGYDTLRSHNPRLVMVSVSGYGQDGPFRDRRAFGRNAEAYAGLSYITGYAGGPPMPSGFPAADCLSAAAAAFGAMCALYERHRNAEHAGQHVDVALYETIFRMQELPALMYDQLGIVADRTDSGSAAGELIVVACTTDDRWVSASRWDIGPFTFPLDTTLPRLAAVQSQLDEVRAFLEQRTLAEVMGTATPHGFATAPVMSNADMLSDPQYVDRGSVVAVADAEIGESVVPAVTPRLGRTPGAVRRSAPALDGDRADILRRWRPAQAARVPER